MAEMLICGHTEIFTEEALRRLSEECRVVLAGNTTVPRKKRKHISIYHTSPEEETFQRLFDVHGFRTVYYVSGYTDGGDGMFGEARRLEEVMAQCEKSRAEKLVVFSTIDSQNYTMCYGKSGERPEKEYHTRRSFRAGQMEELCGYFARKTDICTVVLQLPYLADHINDQNFLGGIFHAIYERRPAVFPYRREDPLSFLTFHDLADLMIQIHLETEDQNGTYFVTGGSCYTYGDLEAMLHLVSPEFRVSYENNPYVVEISEYPSKLRRQYGFVPQENAMEHIGAYYRAFVREVIGRRPGIWERAWDFIARYGKGVFLCAELVFLFLLAEFLSQYTSENVYFRFVDVRLFYIVIIGTMHGMRSGLAAAVLECFALAYQYLRIGVNGTVLFYNIENWIPFAVYLTAGSITGYLSDKKSDALVFLRQEYELLREKYLFLNDIYRGAVRNKEEYKKQILGFKDSFGKIFDAVQKLDGEMPESIFLSGLKVLEDILENHTIAIYTLDSWQKYGRLSVCSNSLVTTLMKSICLEDHERMFAAVKQGDVWRNIQMDEGEPMYACGIFRGGQPALLVTIWKVKVEQYGMNYVNIFQILCGLMQTSFLRALEYEELARAEFYYPNTNIVYPSRLTRVVEVQQEMREEGVADYVLLKLEDQDKARVNERLAGLVRANDVIGADQGGNLYLLLVQMKQENLGIVGERLTSRGLKYQIVEKIG